MCITTNYIIIHSKTNHDGLLLFGILKKGNSKKLIMNKSDVRILSFRKTKNHVVNHCIHI